MTTLKCATTTWNNKEVVELQISDLYQSVPVAKQFAGKPFYDTIKEDINKNGMRFPLLVVEAQFWQLLEQWNMHKKHMMPLPTGLSNKQVVLVVWGGSNRLAIAQELGYTHVDCVVYKNGDFKSAYSDQRLHRDPYTELYSNHAKPTKTAI